MRQVARTELPSFRVQDKIRACFPTDNLFHVHNYACSGMQCQWVSKKEPDTAGLPCRARGLQCVISALEVGLLLGRFLPFFPLEILLGNRLVVPCSSL